MPRGDRCSGSSLFRRLPGTGRPPASPSAPRPLREIGWRQRQALGYNDKALQKEPQHSKIDKRNQAPQFPGCRTRSGTFSSFSSLKMGQTGSRITPASQESTDHALRHEEWRKGVCGGSSYSRSVYVDSLTIDTARSFLHLVTHGYGVKRGSPVVRVSISIEGSCKFSSHLIFRCQ